MRRLALTALLLACACSKKPAQNYRNCLKLRVGMTGAELLQAMGQPDETFPYIEGKTLPHLKGKTAHEWATPTSMPAPNRVTMDDATGKVESIRCGDAQVTTAVYIEPPAPAVVPAPGVSTAPAPAAAETARPRSAPLRERSSSNSRSSGQPLTE